LQHGAQQEDGKEKDTCINPHREPEIIIPQIIPDIMMYGCNSWVEFCGITEEDWESARIRGKEAGVLV
jgi:hypothetical protein